MPMQFSVAQVREDGHSSALTCAFTYALFLVFGVGSWLTINGVFTELPLLVSVLPEGWRLASSIAVVVQFANLGPLLFYAARQWVVKQDPGGRGEERLSTASTYAVLALGALSMGLLAPWWSVSVGGHSLPLLALCCVAAFADCTSSLLFWRFVASFRPVHVSALTAGEGMSGVVSSTLALLQGVSHATPRFSAGVYFALLAAMMCLSIGAFHVLRCSRWARAERQQTGSGAGDATGASIEGASTEGDVAGAFSAKDSIIASTVSGNTHHCGASPEGRCWSLLALQAWLNALQNGVSVSCLALAAKPYGRGAYQAAQTISLIVDPLTAALGFGFQVGPAGLLLAVLALSASYGYILALSLEAVTPPLLSAGGGALLVCLATVGRALTSYVKMLANVRLQERAAPRDKEAQLLRSGVAMQVGAFSGATTMYILIHCTSWFRSAH